MARHDLDLVSLVAGLVFIGMGLGFVLDQTGVVSLDLRLLWPAVLIILGVAGLLGTRRTS
jgi:hypothetical protein